MSNTSISASNGVHPAENLIIGSDEQINTLSKLYPITLPNEKNEAMKGLRTNYKYLYVVNWIYNFRGFIKLQSEYFDVDLFEIELLNMVYPPPIDNSVLFINKLKLSLISTLQNAKLSSLNNFEKVFRLWFGIETPLQGNENEDDTSLEPKFDYLKVNEKIEVLYILISYISEYSSLRSFIDKNDLPIEMLRPSCIHTELRSNGSLEEYLLLFEDSSLYIRSTFYLPLQIPKKRKLAPEDPDSHFKVEQFDVSEVKYELVYRNIYEYNSYLTELKRKPNKKNKTLLAALTRRPVVANLFSNEIKKRKILTNRRKEVQLANLLATRKRSSRLEAKEKQKQEELRVAKLQEEEELKVAAEKRLERRRQARENQLVNAHSYSNGLSREERLRQRKEGSTRQSLEPEKLVSSMASPKSPSKSLESSPDRVVDENAPVTTSDSNQTVKPIESSALADAPANSYDSIPTTAVGENTHNSTSEDNSLN